SLATAVITTMILAGVGLLTAADQSKARVFITDSQSWEMVGHTAGGWDHGSGGFAGSTHGGARPQTAEIIKTFGERCPAVVVNNKQDKADYVVLLDHEGGKGLTKRDNKVAVFNSDGDSIVSHSTRSLGNAVKDACEAIMKDWPTRASREPASAPKIQPVAFSGEAAQAASAAKISVTSTPANADIEVDGSFVGNTPSAIEVTPGEHSVAIKKSGYKAWERKLKVTGGTVNVSAELEKN